MKETTPTILILEDERSLFSIIDKELRKLGFKTRIARYVEQAMELVHAEEHVDAVWLDHFLLGRQDGFHFATALRHEAKKSQRDIPIFVVSNIDEHEYSERYKKIESIQFYDKSRESLRSIVGDVRKKLEPLFV